MDKTLDELLDEKIPRDVVNLRDGGGGRKLSYLEGHYVIDRLNKVFGHTRWSVELGDVRQVINTTSRGEFPAYLVKVRLTVMAPDGVTLVKEAYGYGADKSSQNAHELAIKEARTDALKVAAKDLGMSMGLALYDKTQENVDDGEKPTETKANPSKEESTHEKSVVPNVTGPSPEKVRAHIQSATKLALKKGKSLEEIRQTLLEKFSITSLVEARDEQLMDIKKYVDSLL